MAKKQKYNNSGHGSSLKERNRDAVLELMQKQGLISGLQKQVVYNLIPAQYGFVDGKKKCYATKHARRVDWVKEHLEDLKIYYQLSDVIWNVYVLFIVSEPLISTQVYHQKLEVISRAELSVERIRSIK